ncbi:MAG: DUF2153 family protein [Nitrososphaerota archaeon]|nr:DUF2153 domain-containing protein [Nitrososphaerales archaeon]MDW8044258.1 DUF2153 family protein [Nitrososphaerota archaeon]
MSDWIKSREEAKERISKLSPKDRLDYISACFECINAIGRSNLGWLQWLSNPSLMSMFDEGTLKEFFEKLKSFALAYIDFDIEATKKGMRPEILERGERKPYM